MVLAEREPSPLHLQNIMNEIIESAPFPATATPIELLRIAVQKGTDIGQLERLMELQERWEANEARKKFNVAFSAFKAESVRIIKNKAVTDGPLRGRKYAELFSVVNAVTPALSVHGLSASWKLTKDEKDWIEVTCTVQHIGGHSESVSMGGPPDAGGAKSAIQARASTVTYLERYTLKAITGLSEQDDDDDGNASALRQKIEAERARAAAADAARQARANPPADEPDWRQKHAQVVAAAQTLDDLKSASTAGARAYREAGDAEGRRGFETLVQERAAALRSVGEAV